MTDVRLIPMTAAERRKFVEEELANYADQQIRDAGWPPAEALDRARAELEPVLERELDCAQRNGEKLWSAVERDGESVGWLWVRPAHATGSFLNQITVAAPHRRRGYGRAMLAALEELVAADGIDEVQLNVNVANEPARRLYDAAGYEQVGEDGRLRRLRKRLDTRRRGRGIDSRGRG